MPHPSFAADKTKLGELTQAANGSIAALSRGDLAGRLAATLNKWLKRPG
jgi:hypothetical protein